MRKRRLNKSNKLKIIFITEDEILPKGYLPIAGIAFADEEFQMAIPEKFALEHPEKVNQLADEAKKEFLKIICGVKGL